MSTCNCKFEDYYVSPFRSAGWVVDGLVCLCDTVHLKDRPGVILDHDCHVVAYNTEAMMEWLKRIHTNSFDDPDYVFIGWHERHEREVHTFVRVKWPEAGEKFEGQYEGPLEPFMTSPEQGGGRHMYQDIRYLVPVYDINEHLEE